METGGSSPLIASGGFPIRDLLAASVKGTLLVDICEGAGEAKAGIAAPDGVVEFRSDKCTVILESTDPRLTGTAIEWSSFDEYDEDLDAGKGYGVAVAAWEIMTENGRWTGTSTGVYLLPESEDLSMHTVVLTGAGSYEA